MEIKLLNEETISRISAGEVIERPLNVVKELIENAIDAGATAVTVEIRDGGISMIRVTDNGCGIERDQIARAFVRHATSKIQNADDLSHLSSLGFRGEALASIAAVAQVEMITKVRDSLSGTRAVNDHLAAYSPDAPVRIDLEEIGAPDGTTVIVRSLFGSIPVRRRFLRQPQTEAGYITDLVEKQALSHPGISFHYRVNGQEKLHTTGNGNLQELIYRIYGRETAAALLPVHASDPSCGMRLDGFIGRPQISRSSRSFETFFINGRMLRSKELSAGLEQGYRTDLMQHRFPFAVLHLSMPPEDVDVNVHPSKMEVRFTDRRAVLRFLDESVHEALHSAELIPKASLLTAKEERALRKKEVRLKEEKLQAAPRLEAFETGRAAVPAKSAASPPAAPSVSVPAPGPAQDFRDCLLFEDRRPYAAKPAAAAEKTPDSRPRTKAQNPPAPAQKASPPQDDAKKAADKEKTGNAPTVPQESADTKEDVSETGQLSLEALFPGYERTDVKPEEDDPQDRLLTREKAKHFRYIGQVFGTYWIIEYEDRLLIIDQHAAHEKVNYERMMARISRRQTTSQQLLPPIMLRLTGKEENAWNEFRDIFLTMGYEIEDFGDRSYAIRAVPTELFGHSADSLFREILEEIMEERISGTPQAILSRVASMSCKASVKGKSRLSEEEARALIDELLCLDNPYHCPHGRPTMIVLTQTEMDRKFRRVT